MTDNTQSLATPATELPILAVSAQQLARMLGLSLRTVRTMDAAGKLPRPVRFNGHAVRWVLDGPKGIQAWLTAGAPDRTAFEASQEEGRGGRMQRRERMRT